MKTYNDAYCAECADYTAGHRPGNTGPFFCMFCGSAESHNGQVTK